MDVQVPVSMGTEESWTTVKEEAKILSLHVVKFIVFTYNIEPHAVIFHLETNLMSNYPK